MELARTIAAKRSSPTSDRLSLPGRRASSTRPGRCAARPASPRRTHGVRVAGLPGQGHRHSRGPSRTPSSRHSSWTPIRSSPRTSSPGPSRSCTHRPEWSKALLAAVASKQVPASAVNLNQLRKLQQEQGPGDRRPGQGHLGDDPRGPESPARAGRWPDPQHRPRTPGDPAPAARSSRSCAPSATRSTATGSTSARHHLEWPQRLRSTPVEHLRSQPGHRPGLPGHDRRHGRRPRLHGPTRGGHADRVVLKLQGGKTEKIPRVDVDEIKRRGLADARGDREAAQPRRDRRPVRVPLPR